MSWQKLCEYVGILFVGVLLIGVAKYSFKAYVQNVAQEAAREEVNYRLSLVPASKESTP